MKAKPKKIVEFIFEITKTVLAVVVLMFIIRTYLIQTFVVQGSSMEPTFHNSDYLVLDRLSYIFRNPQRGEIIIFHPPGKPHINFIKRVVGLPGETVKVIDDNHILVNGSPLREPYIGAVSYANEGIAFQSQKGSIYQLSAGEYFVLGDNRSNSKDSRSSSVGPVPKGHIIGRVILRLYPFNSLRLFTQTK